MAVACDYWTVVDDAWCDVLVALIQPENEFRCTNNKFLMEFEAVIRCVTYDEARRLLDDDVIPRLIVNRTSIELDDSNLSSMHTALSETLRQLQVPPSERSSMVERMMFKSLEVAQKPSSDAGGKRLRVQVNIDMYVIDDYADGSGSDGDVDEYADGDGGDVDEYADGGGVDDVDEYADGGSGGDDVNEYTDGGGVDNVDEYADGGGGGGSGDVDDYAYGSGSDSDVGEYADGGGGDVDEYTDGGGVDDVDEYADGGGGSGGVDEYTYGSGSDGDVDEYADGGGGGVDEYTYGGGVDDIDEYPDGGSGGGDVDEYTDGGGVDDVDEYADGGGGGDDVDEYADGDGGVDEYADGGGEIISDNYEPSFVPASKLSIEKLEKIRVQVPSTVCAVCMEEIGVGSEATKIPCSHLYHECCIEEWLQKSGVCPLCKFRMPN